MSLAQARVWNMRVGLPHVCTSRSLSYAIMRTSQKVGRGTYLWVPLTDIDQRDQHYYLEDGAFRECMLLCPITEIAS